MYHEILGVKKKNERRCSPSRSFDNTCITVGVGLGALGAAEIAILGLTCPACFIGSAGMIGIGSVGKLKKIVNKKGKK